MFRPFLLFAIGLTLVAALANAGSEVQPRDLSVVWWNTGCGQEVPESERPHFSQSLLRLSVGYHKPDVLILGEYCASQVPLETLAQLKARFGFSVYIPYAPNNSEVGVMVFSQTPFTISPVRTLDWVPAHEDRQSQREFRDFWLKNDVCAPHFFRPYFFIRITKDEIDYAIWPLHLAHPWWAYQNRFFADSSFKARLAIVTELLLGQKNPLIYQLENFIGLVKQDLGTIGEARPILIGDFNFPEKIGPLRTSGASRLSQAGFSLAAKNQFPSQRDYNLRIDHAFIRNDLGTVDDQILPLLGSDHWPLRIVVRPRTSPPRFEFDQAFRK